MLLDSVLPHPDVSERHQLEIAAAPGVVYRAIHEADLGGHPIIKALLGLRMLPAMLSGRASPFRARSAVTLSVIVENGFGIVAEDPGREIVLGVLGRFWRMTGNVLPFDAVSFSRPLEPGLAKAAWNFTVSPTDTGTLLSTETRVLCADPASLRRFRLYWSFVRPFSGWIRILMLRAIRDRGLAAECARDARTG